MQIDLAHDRPVLIRIARELLQSVPTSDTNLIWHISRRVGDSCAKKSILLNPLRCDRLLRFTIQHDLDRASVWTENTNLQIIAHAMRTQDAKRIGMNSPDEAAHLVTRQSVDLEGFHTFSCTRRGKTDYFALQRRNAQTRNTPAVCDTY